MIRTHRWWTTTVALAFAAGAAAAALSWFGAQAWRVRQAPQSTALSAQTAPLLELASYAALASRNEAPFESGNIGQIEHLQPNTYTLHLRSDNDDALPNWWRQWFYLRLSDVPVGLPVQLTLQGAGLFNHYLPFYSYDNLNWIQFKEEEVTQPVPSLQVFTARFRQKTVWLARYVPYTYSRLQRFLDAARQHPDAQLSIIGKTPQGRDVPVLTITTPAALAAANAGAARAKRRVVIHARTHPGEVASSFVLEGLINFLLGPSAQAGQLRARLVFTILPMLNIDGVVAGNNRVSPDGVNLEGKWYGQPPPALTLDAAATPAEVFVFHSYLGRLLAEGPAVSVALNLHASAGEPSHQAFAFPHFGPQARGYTAAEAELFDKQLKFMKDLAAVQGPAWLQAGGEGGREFLGNHIPERWWWEHFGPAVMAMTIESTYGLAADQGHWMKPNDLRDFGASLAVAIGRFHGIGSLCAVRMAKNLVRCR